MLQLKHVNHSVHWFLEELWARIVAESGTPTDWHHLGKIILQSFKDDPEFIMQIDGGTGASETNRSALERSIRCASCFRNMGLEIGDVIVLMAPNHLDVSIPFYAALYLGIIISAVDRTLGVMELKASFEISKPKVIFCQGEKAPDVQRALNESDLSSQIVTFDKGDYLLSFAEFLDRYGDDTPVEDFKPADFDPEETIGLLISTSGTTGLPKAAAVTQKNLAITIPYVWERCTKFPSPTQMALIGSPLQWLTAIINFIFSPILRFTRLQTSLPVTPDHLYDVINTYKPTYTVLSPTLMTTLIKPAERDRCDFTCFEIIMLGGSAVPQDLIEEMKKITPDTDVCNVYGMSELAGVAFDFDSPPPNSCGKPVGCLHCRLIDVETNEDIYEPHSPGELWLKGPGIFKEYYNNPEATEEAFAEGRWFKTGDMFYKDENWNFYFVERIKLLLKYKSYQISPVQIEGVIRQHPAVLDVAVAGVPDAECGDLPVACVVLKAGHEVTAQQIKDIVKDNLSDSHQLRGGVIFLNEIPMTASTKVHRRKLKQLVLEMKRE